MVMKEEEEQKIDLHPRLLQDDIAYLLHEIIEAVEIDRDKKISLHDHIHRLLQDASLNHVLDFPPKRAE